METAKLKDFIKKKYYDLENNSYFYHYTVLFGKVVCHVTDSFIVTLSCLALNRAFDWSLLVELTNVV